MELDFHFGKALVAVQVCVDELVLVWNKRTKTQKNVQPMQNCPE